MLFVYFIILLLLRAATELNRLLTECNFPSICIHGRLKQDDRIARYQSFKACEKRILVTTDLMGRGIDIEKVNVVINYDFPDDSDYATGSVRFFNIYIYVVSYDLILHYYNLLLLNYCGAPPSIIFSFNRMTEYFTNLIIYYYYYYSCRTRTSTASAAPAASVRSVLPSPSSPRRRTPRSLRTCSRASR